MYRFFVAGVLATSFVTAAPAGDLSVSITLGQPGFYGRIDLGGAPPPQLVYSAPVIVEPGAYDGSPQYEAPAPVYLHVPPGHERHWRKHCREYNACGVPVYFVRDGWYRDVYVPHYREHHRDQDEGRREHDEHWDRHEHEDHHDHHDHDEDHGGR